MHKLTAVQRLVLKEIHNMLVVDDVAPVSTALAVRLGMSTGGIVSVTNALELNGYLVRKRAVTSRSFSTMRLTPMGFEAIGAVDVTAALRNILAVWDAPFVEDAWHDNVVAAIDQARPALIGEVELAEGKEAES